MTQSTIEGALATVLGRVAHDLKNPLAVVVANLRFLEAVGDNDQREAAEESSHAADRLNRMIDDLAQLEAWRSGARLPILSKVSLEEIGDDIQRHITPQLGSRHLEIHLDSAIVTTDRELLGRILFNLVEHGIRQTPARGSIYIESVILGGEGFELRVRDGGPPFAPNIRPSFLCTSLSERADPPPGYRSDQGLALFFAGVAARALGASLAVTPIASGGVSFELTFPAP